MKVSRTSLEAFSADTLFDVAVSIMVFGHIADPQAAFTKIINMLQPNGSLFLIVGDKAYWSTPRFNYEIDIQMLNHGEAASETKRSQGVMYDILRPTENYIQYATNAGFGFSEDVPLIPTQELKEKESKYIKFSGVPISHLLIFRKGTIR